MRPWHQRFLDLRREKQQAYESTAAAMRCDHANTELTRRQVAGGSIQYVRQCRTCGEVLGGPVAHSKVSGPVPDFNPDLPKAFREQAGPTLQQLKKSVDDRWWDLYNAYLASGEWAQRRLRALERDGGTCRACCERKASQVHHLSYEFIGLEPMFHLVSVCKQCHEELHAYEDALRELEE